MLTTIIDTFKRQARDHKTIKAFYYGRNYDLGSGKESYPLFWLEDYLYGHNRNNLFINSVNFSVLFLPNKEQSMSELQNLAFSIGLNIIERIKRDKDSGIGIQPDWSYMTLRHYYDDDACGCRFTVNFTQANMQNLCLIDEQFDTDGKLDTSTTLPHFDLDPANNCEIFVNKFPQFDLKLKR